MHSTPFIKSATLPDEAKIGDEITVYVNAEWPTPNWKHTATQIDFDKENKTVSVKYLGSRGGGMSIMKIHPFSFEVKLKFPEEGTWNVEIHGRAGNCKKRVNIRS